MAARVQMACLVCVQVNNIKKITAQRLLESKLTIPHYYLTMECQVGVMGEGGGRALTAHTQRAEEGEISRPGTGCPYRPYPGGCEGSRG